MILGRIRTLVLDVLGAGDAGELGAGVLGLSFALLAGRLGVARGGHGGPGGEIAGAVIRA